MIIALIPARGGSKRIPRKNLQTIGERSLLEWAIYAAKVARFNNGAEFDRIVVSSDDKEILDVAEDHHCMALKRIQSAADDSASDREVIQDYLNHVRNPEAIDLIAYLRPTSPFRPIHHIEKAVETMLAIPEATGLRSVHEMSESAHKCFQIAPGNILTCLSPTPRSYVGSSWVDCANKPNSCYPETYVGNGIIDIIRPKTFLNAALYGDRCYAYKTKPTIEIDTQWDLQMARLYWGLGNNETVEVWRPEEGVRIHGK